MKRLLVIGLTVGMLLAAGLARPVRAREKNWCGSVDPVRGQ